MLFNTLQRSVIRQLGDKTYLHDIATHGIDSGFPGFCYYSETCAFFKRQRKNIVDLVKQDAKEMGQDPIAFVASFRCLENDVETREEIARCLYGRMRPDDYLVPNALAWFTAEYVAMMSETD